MNFTPTLRSIDVNNIELTRTRDRVTNTEETSQGVINELNAGAYWSQRFAFSKKWDITAAVRADYFSNRYCDQLAVESFKASSTIVSPPNSISTTG